MEAFVKPRSRPEPNLGSRILARRPGRWWRWEGSFGDLGIWEGCEWRVDRFDPPLPGPRVSRVPRKSSVQKKDTKPDPSMCRRWDRLPLISSWVLSETGHPSPITHHQAEVGPAARREISNCTKTDGRFPSHSPIGIDESRSSIFKK